MLVEDEVEETFATDRALASLSLSHPLPFSTEPTCSDALNLSMHSHPSTFQSPEKKRNNLIFPADFLELHI